MNYVVMGFLLGIGFFIASNIVNLIYTILIKLAVHGYLKWTIYKAKKGVGENPKTLPKPNKPKDLHFGI